MNWIAIKILSMVPSRIISNWKPVIDVNSDEIKVKLGTMCDPEYGFTDTAKESGDARYIRITDISGSGGELITTGAKYIASY